MKNFTHIYILLILTTLVIMPNSIHVNSIKNGDVYEYNYEETYSFYSIEQKDSIKVTCNITAEFKGVFVIEIIDIRDDNVVGRSYFKDLLINKFIKCSDPLVEFEKKRELENRIDEIKTNFTKPVKSRVSPIDLYRGNIVLTLYDRHVGKDLRIESKIPIITINNYSTVIPGTYREENIFYRGMSCRKIYIDAETQVKFLNFNFNYKIKVEAFINYSDLVMYFINYNLENSIFVESTNELVSILIRNIRFEVKNIEVFKEYVDYVFKLDFSGKITTLSISGLKLNITNYSFENNKVVLKITGSGLGGILIKPFNGINVSRVFINSTESEYIYEILPNNQTVVKIPIVHGERVVEIEFTEQLTKVELVSIVSGSESIQPIETTESVKTTPLNQLHALEVVEVEPAERSEDLVVILIVLSSSVAILILASIMVVKYFKRK